LREAAVRWMARRFGVTLDPDLEVAACVGTKELVASTPHYLRLREPERDTVLVPAVAYPTYEMGALLAGCRTVPVPEAPGGGLDLGAVSDADAARALLLWVNSPANPTGSLSDLDGIARWGRARGVPVFSDECYVEFTWNGPGQTVLAGGVDGVVAVHSLSKRSNLAGLRAGFFAGDPSLVQYLADVRRHSGLMVPGPVQAAVAVALDDDAHVEIQRSRYRERLEFLAAALQGAGFPATMPEGGFYLWVPVDPEPAGGGGGWHAARELVETAGILTSPGELYGADGAGHVRIAVVQPMERLELVAERLDHRPAG
jgi:aspartate/methionine/tyrosine aminotransferase